MVGIGVDLGWLSIVTFYMGIRGLFGSELYGLETPGGIGVSLG